MNEIVSIAEKAVSKRIVGAPLVEFKSFLGRIELPAASVSALRRHAWLREWGEEARWVPSSAALLATQNTIDQVLQQALRPACESEVRQAVTILAGSWPNARPPDPEIYIGGLLQELAGYSAAVLSAAVSRARRTLEWIPSIAAMVTLCEEERKKIEALSLVLSIVGWQRKPLEAHCNNRRRDFEIAIGRAQYRFGEYLPNDPVLKITVNPVDLDLAARFLEVRAGELLYGHEAWPDLADPAPIELLAAQARAAGIKTNLEIDERE